MAALLGALVFGYVVGEIGTLIAHLDRQAGLVEERIDNVKEYLRWRRIPRDLSVRIRESCRTPNPAPHAQRTAPLPCLALPCLALPRGLRRR